MIFKKKFNKVLFVFEENQEICPFDLSSQDAVESFEFCEQLESTVNVEESWESNCYERKHSDETVFKQNVFFIVCLFRKFNQR